MRMDDEYKDLRLPESSGDTHERIDELVKSMRIRGELDGSPTAVLLGQYYHLGGLAATKILASEAAFSSGDVILDVCCSVGGSTRYLAETVGCRTVGLDSDARLIALARRLTELAGLRNRVTFVQEDLYRADQLGQRFSGIWSEASLDNSVDWLPALNEALLPGGKLAISLCVRAENASSGPPNSLSDVVLLLSTQGFDILFFHDMREWEIEHGWKALLRELDENQSFYEGALGADWVHQARERFHSELEIWSTTAGNAFIVARKIGNVA
jgi:SAM-dependent methyltransferase